MSCTREQYVAVAKKYLGYNEDDGSYMKILKAYDDGLVNTDVCRRWGTRNLKFTPNAEWHWCAAFVSAMGYLAGCTDVVPYEMSVWSIKQFAIDKGIWVPYKAGRKPSVGDLVIFDWDGGHSECDHVGIVASVGSSSFSTVEGNTGGHGSGDNYKGTVGSRNVSFTNSTVTGYVHPKFSQSAPTPKKEDSLDDIEKLALEVIDGKWGNDPERKERLEQAGHNYMVIQARVNAILKEEAKPKEPEKQYHIVVKGDTLWKISKQYGLTLDKLISLNPQIEDPNLIYVDDKVRVR